VLNSAHSNAVQTFWFRLGGNRGLDIVEDASSRRIDCATKAPIGGTEPAPNPSWDSLFYQAYTGRYSYPWKTTTAYRAPVASSSSRSTTRACTPPGSSS
jgi:hypothetical protein